MDPHARAALGALAADGRSGASELLPRAIEILRRAQRGDAASLAEVARAVGGSQPSMASFWNLALAALREAGEPGALDRFEQRWRRSASGLTRVAVDLLSPGDAAGLHVTTCSFSSMVAACLRALAGPAALTVACSEGRPALEGRRLAEVLASEGVAVRFSTDAALAAELDRSDVVLVGADAVTPGWILNKSGTLMLAAAAARAGVPAYVLATRDKFVDARVARLLRIEAHDPAEVWDGAPPGVVVCNAYFERVPLDLVAGVITDTGVLAADQVAEGCRAASAGVTAAMIEALA
jgi:translation initiation factor 2B subunit (eIF-2B alpha/beta/delta family)